MQVDTLPTHSLSYIPGEPFEPTITVDRTVLPIAIKHGMELWWDDSSPRKRLDDRGDSQFARFVNARIEGKVAEVAFSKLLERYFDIESQVDWRIYGDYTETDDGDLQYLVGDDGEEYPMAVDMDVKKTKPYNQWLAIRREIFDSKLSTEAPIVLAKHQIRSEIDVDQWKDTDAWDVVDADDDFRQKLLAFADDEFPIRVEFTGTAYKDEFTDDFDQGDRLYDPDSGAQIGPQLKRDNAGIHVSDLDSRVERWNRIVADIVGDNPVSWRPLPIVDGGRHD